MSNNTIDGSSFANSAPNVKQGFAQARQEQAYKLTQLSPEAQTKAAVLEDVYQKRSSAEKNSQQRSRAFREMKVKTKLLEDYVRSDAPRPSDPQSKANDLQVIDSEAKRMVGERETYYLQKIEQERHSMLAQVINEASVDQQQTHNADHAQTPDKAQDHAQNQPVSPDHGASPDLEPEQER